MKARSQTLLEQIWRTYSRNTLDNYLRGAAEWAGKPSEADMAVWFERQMPFNVEMGQKLLMPDGAGMLFVVTGRVSVNEQEVNAPKLLNVSFETRLAATRSSRIIWLAAHPGFVVKS